MKTPKGQSDLIKWMGGEEYVKKLCAFLHLLAIEKKLQLYVVSFGHVEVVRKLVVLMFRK